MNQEKIKKLENIINSGYDNIAGIMVQKNGVNLYERYFNGYTADNAFHVYSVTKSIFSALVGIAVDKGYIKSINQSVMDFFPDYKVKAGERAIYDVTIKHLLTMTAPYKTAMEPYEEFFSSGNWVEFALDLLGGEKPAGEFMYSPIVGTHILSGILAVATGRPILDFAMENLFTPLGIEVKENVVLAAKEEHIAFGMRNTHTRGWVVDPQGLNTASWGLTLTLTDMGKIGRLYLDGGVKDGKQIIPAGWIRESTREQSRWNELSYGYLWWIINNQDPIYAALGDGGNALYINEKNKMVVAIASLFGPEVKDRIEFITGVIEPMFGGE